MEAGIPVSTYIGMLPTGQSMNECPWCFASSLYQDIRQTEWLRTPQSVKFVSNQT